jgi:hypothetical protein
MFQPRHRFICIIPFETLRAVRRKKYMDNTFKEKFTRFLASRKFLYLILGFFVFEAGWLALSSVYPMAFDEDYHFGLIQLYSQHILPFFSEPTSAYKFGEITRDPSYMYHYLMGFPYRVIELFTKNMTDQVIALRFIDIAMFSGGIVIFRKVLLRLKISKALANTVLLFFILTPMSSLLAAQINYDNMLFLCVPITFLLALRFVDRLKSHKEFSLPLFIGWLSACLFTSLVMYTFLPIFLAMTLYLAYILYKQWWHKRRTLFKRIADSYKHLERPVKIGLILLLIISGGLFVERDGYNTIRYGTPTPECNQVLSVQDCTNFGSWERNYNIAKYKSTYVHPTTYQFTRNWIHTMFYNLFFAINGINSGFFAQPPLPLPEWSAGIIAVSGIGLLTLYRKKIFANDAAKFFGVIIFIYVTVLWLQNYSDYLHLGETVGVNGRYLIPVLLLVYALVGVAFRELLKKRELAKPLLTIVVILLFLNGGGIMTYMVRNDPSWYRSSIPVAKANQKAQMVLRPLIVGSNLSP